MAIGVFEVISVSLVSHGHGSMVWRLVKQLVYCHQITQIIVTLNIPEIYPDNLDNKVVLIHNEFPRGFGENHNAAFSLAKNEFYCVINPDIELTKNPFQTLLRVFSDQNVALVAPLVIGSNGEEQDSMRRFITPLSMIKRVLNIESGMYIQKNSTLYLMPDWVAGMFMLFRSEIYGKVGGFDQRYFMYCEDVDICTRLWKKYYKIVGCLSARVIHNPQRASHRSFKHLTWHLLSVFRYFSMHSFSLPDKNIVIKDASRGMDDNSVWKN